MRRNHKPCQLTAAHFLVAGGSARPTVCVAAMRRNGSAARSCGPRPPWRFPSTTDGRWVDPKGYVYIKCPAENHPNAKSKKGWIAEHNWVMTQMLGRPLRPGETVHHRNLIKAEHPGQPGAVDKPSAEGRPCGRSFGVVLVVHPPIRRAPCVDRPPWRSTLTEWCRFGRWPGWEVRVVQR